MKTSIFSLLFLATIVACTADVDLINPLSPVLTRPLVRFTGINQVALYRNTQLPIDSILYLENVKVQSYVKGDEKNKVETEAISYPKDTEVMEIVVTLPKAYQINKKNYLLIDTLFTLVTIDRFGLQSDTIQIPFIYGTDKDGLYGTLTLSDPIYKGKKYIRAEEAVPILVSIQQ